MYCANTHATFLDFFFTLDDEHAIIQFQRTVPNDAGHFRCCGEIILFLIYAEVEPNGSHVEIGRNFPVGTQIRGES